MKMNKLARQTIPTIKVNRCNKHTYYYKKLNYCSANKHIPQTKICNNYD